MDRPVYLSADDCECLLTPEHALRLAEEALRWESAGQVVYPPARALRMSFPQTGFRFHSKAVALPEIGVAGARVVAYGVAADGSRPDASRATRLIVLMEMSSGVPLAIVDEHYNYSLRTAASVGVAARQVRKGPVRLGIIGAGVVARACVPIMLTALDVTGVMLHSRTASRCDQLAELVTATADIEVVVTGSAEDVLAGCDIVVMATTASSPIQRGALRPGIVVCALGSNEIDAAGYLSADHFIVDDWAQTLAAHDIAAMVAAGHPLEEHVSATLPDLVAGETNAAAPDESVIIRTEGLASQDILFAHWAWQEYTR